jgi:hypothetical protein
MTRTTEARDKRRGIPQGSPLSPLLANLYMRRFVLGWKMKDRASEITMDDLTAELRRGLDPPYDAVKQELVTRFAGMDEATQRKAGRKFAREIGMFIRESDKSLH